MSHKQNWIYNKLQRRTEVKDKYICKVKLHEEHDTDISRNNVIRWLESLPDDNEWFYVNEKDEMSSFIKNMSQICNKKKNEPTRKVKSLITNPTSEKKNYVNENKEEIINIVDKKKNLKVTRQKEIVKAVQNVSKTTSKATNLELSKEKLKKKQKRHHPYNTRLSALNKMINQNLDL